MTWITILYESLGKATILLAAACATVVVLKGSSAAVRHFVWMTAFAALLGLPAAMWIMPGWTPAALRPVPSMRPAVKAAVTTSRNEAAVHTSAAGITPASKSSSPATMPFLLVFIWAAGALAAASRFIVGALRTSWMVRRAAEADYARPRLAELCQSLKLSGNVRVLESDVAPMPLTWGIVRPVVVLPEHAPAWPATRLETVLLHELVHVKRRDLLAQVIARAACSLYWFHPLVWVALRQLRSERERACDDAVLLHGVAAHDYAGHLVDLVRGLAVKRSPWADAPAMAESSDLESRVKAMLDRDRNRRPLSGRLAVTMAGLVVAVLLPLAAITAHAQAAVGTLTGTVTDPSGARIPNCRVVAKSVDGTNQETVIANEAGEYRFASIPAGRYAVAFMAPGFAVGKAETVLVSGAVARVDSALELGAVQEAVVIHGQGMAARPAARTEVSGKIRVGGMVSPIKLVHQEKPIYPPELQQLGVEGTVVISAIISKDGAVLSPRVRNTVDSRLAKAALDAVRQWTYQPALLNGEPVEILTTISLDFQLGQ